MRGSNKNLLQLEKKINYSFNDIEILKQALTHRSVGSKNNERLEFLGDSILNFAIGLALFQKFPKAQEGELSRMRATLVRESTLAMLAKRFDLSNSLVLGAGELKSGGMHRDSILSDAVEAIIAAIYLDNNANMQALVPLVWEWFGDLLQEITPTEQKDPKTKLQEYLQGRAISLPDYNILDISGPAHNQSFTAICSIESLAIQTEGKGRSRRKAEQNAAEQALNQILENKKNAKK